jgi:hypothetical protein
VGDCTNELGVGVCEHERMSIILMKCGREWVSVVLMSHSWDITVSFEAFVAGVA